MTRLKLIRQHLGVTQTVLGQALGCVQGGIAAYESGRDLPRKRAEKLIEFAATKGCRLTFDHVYGDLPLPSYRMEAVVAGVACD
ncbi:helix-turn-helix domain-containing protein [Delftia acidovorans]|uniref:helix-turn-helix domain-containing protein n=1 Tax=Delftia acidovorans TaxID=80866 RepID=UPI003342B77B